MREMIVVRNNKCKLFQEALEDEKKAVPFYENLRKNIDGAREKNEFTKIINDERKHYKKIHTFFKKYC